jgi:hypothetical protein
VRSHAILACAVTVTAFLAGPAPAGAANEDDGGRVLHTGRCLVASAKHPAAMLASRSNRFVLVLSPTSLYVHNEVRLSGGMAAAYTTWRRATGGSASSLCMQRNGNLVLRGGGKVAWSSRTAGTGAHNFAVLRDTGRLLVRTAGGRTVWSTHTTPVLMRAGDRLASGSALRNATDPAHVTRLRMRRDGDLVLTRGTAFVWHSGTAVRGSYLVVTARGRLVVRGPDGSRVWSSASVGEMPLLTVRTAGRLTFESFATGRCWVRPSGATCG